MSSRSVRRKPGKCTPSNRIFILTEGEATEVEYFRGVRQLLGIPKELVIVEKAASTHPKGIVDELVDKKKENKRLAKSGKDTLIDQWWGVFDTEGRPEDIGEAVQKARANEVYLAISDLSFEYWLLLHFCYTTASFDSVGDLIGELGRKGRLPGYCADNKHPDMDALCPLLPDAMKNARLVRENYTMKGYSQPRTDCDLLADAIAGQARCPRSGFPFKPFERTQLSMYVCG